MLGDAPDEGGRVLGIEVAMIKLLEPRLPARVGRGAGIWGGSVHYKGAVHSAQAGGRGEGNGTAVKLSLIAGSKIDNRILWPRHGIPACSVMGMGGIPARVDCIILAS